MEMKSKFFPELTTRELYEILKARADVIISSGIDNVATVITELAEENEDYLPDIIENANRFLYSAVCRLGWMLEHVAEESSLDELEDYC